MEIDIIERKKNNLIEREEVKFKIVHKDEKTPSRAEVREKLIEKLKCTPEVMVIGSVKSEFGRAQSNGIAHLYKTKEKLEKIEPLFVRVRDKLAEPKSKKKAPVEEQKSGTK